MAAPVRSWLPTVMAAVALAVAASSLISARDTQSDLDRLNSRVDALEQSVGDTSGLDDLDSRLAELEDADLDGRVSDLEQNIDDICSGVEISNTNSATEELIDNISFACP